MYCSFSWSNVIQTTFFTQIELHKLSEANRHLLEDIEISKTEHTKLLENFQQKSDEFELLRSEIEGQLEKCLSGSSVKISELKFELERNSLELEQNREKMSRLEIELENRSDDALNMTREVEALRKCLNETERKFADSEKEILSITDRERAQKEFNQQMSAYHKELQDQIT